MLLLFVVVFVDIPLVPSSRGGGGGVSLPSPFVPLTCGGEVVSCELEFSFVMVDVVGSGEEEETETTAELTTEPAAVDVVELLILFVVFVSFVFDADEGDDEDDLRNEELPFHWCFDDRKLSRNCSIFVKTSSNALNLIEIKMNNFIRS